MLTALATIAIAVGANALVFSLIHTVLLRPLPFREPERLVHIWQTHPSLGNLAVTYPDYLDWKKSRSFASLETYTFQATNKVTLTGTGAPEQLQATMVSQGLFPMLGISLLRGRNFSPQEEREKQHVALISESLWRRKFGADPNMIGRAMRVPPFDLTVIGIVKQSQAFPVWADIWLPLTMLEPGLTGTRRFHPLEVAARLRPGTTLAEAQTEMSAIAGGNTTAHPVMNKNMGAFVIPMLDQVTGPVRPILLVVWMAVSLILSMACANVAHLLLTRTVSRSRELAIRISLGATWKNITKLLAAESLLLVGAGATIGALLAATLLPQLRDIALTRIPRIDEIRFDTPVFLYTLAAAALTALLILVPSVAQVFRREVAATARKGGRIGSGLMISEIAFSFVVLGSALLLMRSFTTLLAVHSGFESSHVLAMNVWLPAGADGWEGTAKLFEDKLKPSLRAVPGVEVVASANMAPLSLGRTETSRWATRFGVKGVQYSEGAFPVAQIRFVTEDYFAALKIPLLRGRTLTAADRKKPLWLINDTLARQFFPGLDPVGRELLTDMGTPQPSPVTVAGVVGDVRDLSLDAPPRPTIYALAVSPGVTILLRTTAGPRSVAPAVQDIIRQAVPDAPITRVQPLDAIVAGSLSRYRFALELMMGFAAIAAALSLIGIYGVVAYSVGRRTREFGVRSAIGAGPRDLIRLVVWEGARLSAMGILAGVLLFGFVSRLFRSVLFQVSTMDGITLALTAAIVIALSMLALAIPARRASMVNPNAALREG